LHVKKFITGVICDVSGFYNSREGCNPEKPGGHPHSPIFAFIADFTIIANLLLRSSNNVDLTGSEGFLKQR